MHGAPDQFRAFTDRAVVEIPQRQHGAVVLGQLREHRLGDDAVQFGIPVLAALERGGASIVEIGFPFSDPIADGPVIAAAMHQAIAAGTTPETLFDAVAAARPGTGLGLVAMVSVSLVYRCGGPEGFCRRASAAGLDGLIVPDAPFEEAGGVMKAAADAGEPLVEAT